MEAKEFLNGKKIKKMAFYQATIDGEFKCVVSVNGVKHLFDMFEKALTFHRKEYKSFEKDGFDIAISVISIPLSKSEMKRALGK